MNERVSDERASHSFPIWAEEESCRCGNPAAHKVEEVSGPAGFHPLTAYLCCEHFGGVVGSAHGRYPYEFDQPLSTSGDVKQ
jgi:hypothetical protein